VLYPRPRTFATVSDSDLGFLLLGAPDRTAKPRWRQSLWPGTNGGATCLAGGQYARPRGKTRANLAALKLQLWAVSRLGRARHAQGAVPRWPQAVQHNPCRSYDPDDLTDRCWLTAHVSALDIEKVA
jgi:hypothetical protein